MTGSGIRVRGLTKSFRTVRAVDDLSFEVAPGMVTGFLGPNGAGKTTTLRILLGLVTPDQGDATISGVAYRDIPAPATVVGAALDAAGFHPARSGRGHLRIYCAINGLPGQRADDVLHLVGLSTAADRKIGGYSLGMRQRLALAVAMLGDPQVLVLDEPANGLDPEGIVWMRRLLRRLAAEGRTVLVSSHVLTEMQQLVDRVVIIAGGRLLYQGAVNELTDRQSRVVEVRAQQAGQLRAALTKRAGVTVEPSGGRLVVRGLDASTVGRIAYLAGLELHWLAERDGGLEQLFFSLTGPETDQPTRTSDVGS
jgi:ABC-2 type transport system ATP-binding protein